MRAFVFDTTARAARLVDAPEPVAGAGELLLRVEACGLCRTDQHILDGELVPPRATVVLGHQIVGVVLAAGPGAPSCLVGRRVGVPWLGGACGTCAACVRGRENLCDQARFTGFHRDGGLAERVTCDHRFALELPDALAGDAAAPLLCAGLIGWRTLRLAGDPVDVRTVGIYGFGAAAHLIAQVLRTQGRRFLAFTRPGDTKRQAFARELGAAWAGGSDQPSPEPLDAALLFAADGALVPRALAAVVPGGTVVCGEIHMSDIPSFPYASLWRERALRSVANLTRADGREFLAFAAAATSVRAQVTRYPIEEVERALAELRSGGVRGAAVVVP
jgi:propanol-preferring alcohol dehydrogenase